MIDTGSTRSFISPDKANQFFAPYIYYEPFEVISTHASSTHDKALQIPLLPTFKSADYHKFYIYNVDSRYDGLIGNDLLKQLDAIIDLKENMLRTKTTSIPIVHNYQKHVITLAPRTEQRIELPTDQYSGEAILEYKQFCDGVRMPSAIVNCIKGFATTVIQNSRDEEMILTITRPFSVTSFKREQCQLNYSTDNNSVEIDNLLKENLERLRIDHTNEEERKKILELCLEYRDIFHCDQIPLSFTNEIKHFIRTKHEDPIYVKPYRQSPAEAEEIKNQVEQLQKNNIIQESFSPWNAPVHLVPKKPDASGVPKYRMVIDYRRLNDITTDDKYPLPNMTDIFDKLGKSTYFTTLDLASGYHQVEINEDDRQKTAFSTQFGHFEFLRMPFGLKTAPATFQRAMNNVLRGLQGIHCLIYLDDVIIFSVSLEEHIHKLRMIFDRLRATNLKVQLDKSEFLRKEVNYLGHTITTAGLKPNDDKIKTVLDYPIPKTTTEIKSFLGLVGYYRKFIKDFAKVTQPLTKCLKKRNKIIIDQIYIDAFNKCKELLTTAPLLQYPDMEKAFVLTTDASTVALGAVLSQGPIGSDKPVAYASRTLSDTEARYSTIERELLAIVWAVKHFRPYLYGRKFVIYTDHRPLVWLNSLKEPNSKLTRWRLRLQEYDFEVIYKNGKQNANADALSRIKINVLDSDDDITSMQVNLDDKEQRLQRYLNEVTDQITKLSTDNHDDQTIVISDSSTLSAQEEFFPLPPASSTIETVHSAADLESYGIPILHEAIDTKPNQILVFTWLRNELQVRDLSRQKQKVLEIFLPINNTELIKSFLKEYIKPKLKYFIYFESEEHRKEFSAVIISLFKQDMINFYECTERVVYVENEKEQKAIILQFHTGKTSHRGIKETMVRLKRNYFWANMQETVSAVINACEACRKMKYDRKPIKPFLQLTPTQHAPFQEIFIDLFTIDGIYYLTIVDAFSKLGQAIKVTNRSTPEVIRALIYYFSIYGVPRKITSDPGMEFNNALMKELISMYKIELHITTPNNPNSTGIVERFHSTLIEIYRLASYEQKCTDAATIMAYSIMSYNHTIHSKTGLTPFEVVFGHTDSNSIFNIDFEKQYISQLLKDHAKRTKYLYRYISDKMIQSKEKERTRKGGEADVEFEEGDTVYIKDINVRKGKDKPRYKKAVVTGQVDRNIVPVKVGSRLTKAPIKNVKRPPQNRSDAADPDEEQPGPSTASN